jgi:hypothetical protein
LYELEALGINRQRRESDGSGSDPKSSEANTQQHGGHLKPELLVGDSNTILTKSEYEMVRKLGSWKDMENSWTQEFNAAGFYF